MTSADVTNAEEEGAPKEETPASCCIQLRECLRHECDSNPAVRQPSFGLDSSCPRKMLGSTCCGPPRAATVPRMWWSWLGSFLGIAVIALMAQYVFNPLLLPSLYGSFGATAVLLYAAPASPLGAQLRTRTANCLASWLTLQQHSQETCCWATLAQLSLAYLCTNCLLFCLNLAS